MVTPRRLLFLVLILGAGGCAFVDEKIALDPTSALPRSDVGHGRTVALAVADERPNTAIGRRGPQRSADIRATEDVARVVERAVDQGLRAQGFQTVTPITTEPVTLDVQVRDLSYDASMGFWTGGIHTRAALKAIAHNAGQTYEQFYRAEKEERVLVVPTEASDAAAINEILSRAIDGLLGDQRLLDFLAAAPAIPRPDGAVPPAAPPST